MTDLVTGRVQRKGTATKSFGTGRREGHDASAFYGRALFKNATQNLPAKSDELSSHNEETSLASEENSQSTFLPNQLHLHSSETMPEIPSGSVGLAFTSPPYNVGKEYDDDMPMDAYLRLIENVGSEVYRTLVDGGRYVINVANLGRSPYVPLTAHFWQIHQRLGFIPMGEVIWQKAQGASNSVAWGSWMRASAPRLRDLHEYLLVLAKGSTSRRDKGISTLARDEFMSSTLSIWDIPAESARRIGHPAPFPLALAEKVINLWSFQDDVVLDPFAGSGTTCVAAQRMGRKFVGYDISADYIEIARKRLAAPYTPGFAAGMFGYERA